MADHTIDIPDADGTNNTAVLQKHQSLDLSTDDEAQRQYLIELDKNVETTQYLGKRWAIVNLDWYEAWLAFWNEPDEVSSLRLQLVCDSDTVVPFMNGLVVVVARMAILVQTQALATTPAS